MDDKANLDGSELELLLPLSDTKDLMSYTQIGIRHVDKRTTANIGLGQRHFSSKDSMAGYNIFLNHDISQNHIGKKRKNNGVFVLLSENIVSFG